MEIIAYIPGQGTLIDLKEDKGMSIAKFEYNDLSKEYALAQEKGMLKAMDELLHPLIPGFPSKAECKLGTSWASK
jgi:hypothetical protein